MIEFNQRDLNQEASLTTTKPGMSVSTKQPIWSTFFNLPNQLTVSRLVLSIVLFAFLGFRWYTTSLVLFVLAASTDWLDGYFARKYGQVTVLGRILDPFVDKVIVCGTFIFLVSVPESEIKAWMAVVIVGRELLITAIRSFLEQQGADFSANMSGKLKMVFQCIAAGVSLFYLAQLSAGGAADWVYWLLIITVYTAVVLTITSGIAYIRAAISILDS